MAKMAMAQAPQRSVNSCTKAYSAASATSPLSGTTIARRDPTEHDVQIEILFCGICHSDLHSVRNEWSEFNPTVYPIVPGHEIVGRVDLLEQIDDPGNPKTRFINLSGVLHDPDPSGQTERRHTRERNERFGNEGTLDEAIVLEARDVMTGRSKHLAGR